MVGAVVVSRDDVDDRPQHEHDRDHVGPDRSESAARRDERGGPHRHRREGRKHGARDDPLDTRTAELSGRHAARHRAGNRRNQHHAAQLAQRGAPQHHASRNGRQQEVGDVGRFRCERTATRAGAQAQGNQHGNTQSEHRGAVTRDVGRGARIDLLIAQEQRQVEERQTGDEHRDVGLVHGIDPVAVPEVVAAPSGAEVAGHGPDAQTLGHRCSVITRCPATPVADSGSDGLSAEPVERSLEPVVEGGPRLPAQVDGRTAGVER